MYKEKMTLFQQQQWFMDVLAVEGSEKTKPIKANF